MPTERFDRLPEDKKKCILRAAIKEFARVPFEKASINKIIKDADISRGSFYTYFEDKRDLLKCIFSDIIEDAQQFCRESLERNRGDYWKMMDEFLQVWVRFKWSGNIMEIFRIAVIQTDTEELMRECRGPGNPDTFERWIYDNGDWSQMRCQDYEFIRLTVALGMQTLVATIGQLFKFPEQTEEFCRLYTKKMEILRYGACRQVSAEEIE